MISIFLIFLVCYFLKIFYVLFSMFLFFRFFFNIFNIFLGFSFFPGVIFTEFSDLFFFFFYDKKSLYLRNPGAIFTESGDRPKLPENYRRRTTTELPENYQ